MALFMFNEPELNVQVRTQKALHHSYALVHQSDRLIATSNPSRTVRAQSVFPIRGRYSFLNWVLDSALRITNASKGNLQIFDRSSGMLRIVAQRGFKQPFLDYFDSVHTGEAACGAALQRGGRVIVEDVTASPIFHATPALEVLLDADVRSVQSTPLVGPSGNICGMLSTHWSSPRPLGNEVLIPLEVLASTVGRWLELKSASLITSGEVFESGL